MFSFLGFAESTEHRVSAMNVTAHGYATETHDLGQFVSPALLITAIEESFVPALTWPVSVVE